MPDENKITPEIEALVERKVKEASRQKNQTINAWSILVLGALGCMPPVVAIYGLIYLLINRRPFRFKTLAIIGTIIAWLWTVVFILVMIAMISGRISGL